MNSHDDARDPHLREALRHAPDAHLQAPAALGDLILKAARARARDPHPTARADTPRWATRLWDWLARPAVATGFAGVMAATLVGLMWWDRPMDEAMPRAPSPPTSPSASVSQAPAATPAPPTAPTPAPASTAAPTPVPAPPAATAERDRPARAEAKRRIAQPGNAGDHGPAKEPAAARASAESAAATEQVEPSPPRSAARAPSAMPDHHAHDKAGAPAELRALRERSAADVPSLARLRSALDGELPRWTWQDEGNDPQPVNDAVRAWLARLDADTGDRWQPASTAALPRGRTLRLFREGQLQHDFRLVEGGVLWQRRLGPWQFTGLPSSSVNELEAAMP